MAPELVQVLNHRGVSDHDTSCGCCFLPDAGHTVDIYSLTGSQPFDSQDFFTFLKWLRIPKSFCLYGLYLLTLLCKKLTLQLLLTLDVPFIGWSWWPDFDPTNLCPCHSISPRGCSVCMDIHMGIYCAYCPWHLLLGILGTCEQMGVWLDNLFRLCLHTLCIYIYIYIYIFTLYLRGCHLKILLKDALCVRGSSEVVWLDSFFWKRTVTSVCIEWFGMGRSKNQAGQLKGI